MCQAFERHRKRTRIFHRAKSKGGLLLRPTPARYFRPTTISSHPLRYVTRALLHFGGRTRASHCTSVISEAQLTGIARLMKATPGKATCPLLRTHPIPPSAVAASNNTRNSLIAPPLLPNKKPPAKPMALPCVPPVSSVLKGFSASPLIHHPSRNQRRNLHRVRRTSRSRRKCSPLVPKRCPHSMPPSLPRTSPQRCPHTKQQCSPWQTPSEPDNTAQAAASRFLPSNSPYALRSSSPCSRQSIQCAPVTCRFQPKSRSKCRDRTSSPYVSAVET